MRLSKDDERSGESLSIENQRKILTEYITQQGWTLYDEYVDDGISGTTFERPGVQRLLDDAKTGRINLTSTQCNVLRKRIGIAIGIHRKRIV